MRGGLVSGDDCRQFRQREASREDGSPFCVVLPGSDPDPEHDAPAPAAATIVAAPILATAITAPTPPAITAPVASPHVLCELEAFLGRLAALSTFLRIFDIGPHARPGRRII